MNTNQAKPTIAVGMDHVGMNVPDMEQALQFFTEVMGFHHVTELGKLPLDEAWKKRYHIRLNAEVEKVIMLRAGNGSSLELFQYKSPERNMERPLGDDVGWYHLGFYTDDINASVAYLKSKGITVLNEPITVAEGGPNTGETWVYFVTPWGLQIELVNYRDGKAYEKENPPVVLWSPKDNREKPGVDPVPSAKTIELVNKHLQIWTETDNTKRLALAEKVYAYNIRIIDPGVILNGRAEVSNFIGGLLKQNPGFEFTLVKPIETHHNAAILSWQFGPKSKPDTITGQDIFTIAEDKIVSLLVFVDGVTK
ncbi:SnoaL-like domain-containing protein [Mucilaginibacter sp. HC2]|uniref:VOC family protein n=1 Tax=Mucilaginibacter inviolabilis TaxID=2714892 RepID=UPI00140A3845|nr:VOC family protein [Mucilaginibacter inviolabilis]NHA04892.1 SnoaL-like domain-containing protein [Mucilaginibacter inviolabilis]